MKIAIYHNLEKGGALIQLTKIVKNIYKNNEIDIFCHKNLINNRYFKNIYVYKLKKTNNIFQHLLQIFFELKNVSKEIAANIGNKYDLVLVFQCSIIQSPYILKYLSNQTKYIYILNEPKREFYEKTSFDYYSFKRTLSRIVRYPIRLIDILNTRKAKVIISNSYYSENKIKKIYGKKSFVIYPGLKETPPRKCFIKNNNKIISIGLLSKIKGHTFSLYELSGLIDSITIIGRSTHEYNEIIKVSKKTRVKINLVSTESNKKKIEILKKSSIYLANNENEPFGITTLEATNNNIFVVGKNQGGTPEIIKNGLSGVLHPCDIKVARKNIRDVLNNKNISSYKTVKMNWKMYVEKIFKIYQNEYA